MQQSWGLVIVTSFEKNVLYDTGVAAGDRLTVVSKFDHTYIIDLLYLLSFICVIAHFVILFVVYNIIYVLYDYLKCYTCTLEIRSST